MKIKVAGEIPLRGIRPWQAFTFSDEEARNAEIVNCLEPTSLMREIFIRVPENSHVRDGCYNCQILNGNVHYELQKESTIVTPVFFV